MNQGRLVRAMLAAAVAALALTTATAASAHEYHGRWEARGAGYYAYPYYQHHYHPHFVRERVVVRELPPAVYGPSAYYPPPGVVIGVNIPPLVIPLR